jgi:hypothetical protein
LLESASAVPVEEVSTIWPKPPQGVP